MGMKWTNGRKDEKTFCAIFSHKRLKGVGDVIGELHELRDAELLRPAGERIGMKGEERGFGRQHLTQAHAQHLATLVEGGLHHTLEEFLVAAQLGHLIAHHADDGALHLGRRVEN